MSVATQQLVILSQDNPSDNGLAPIGDRDQILERLRGMNTGPQREGEDVLFGPGILIELPPEDPVTQMLMTITEEEIGWQVIMRLAKIMRWKLFDPVTGREFIPQGADEE